MMLMLLVALLPAAQAENGIKQIVDGFLQVIAEPELPSGGQAPPAQAKEPSMGEQLMLGLRGSMEALLDSYKKEGREYARELGGIVTQRIMEDKKINDTLDSMRIFCWAVIIYLTVISLIVLYMLLRLRVLYANIMEELKSK